MKRQLPTTAGPGSASSGGRYPKETVAAGTVIHNLHGLVTYGPGDLHIAAAMSAQGYDAAKWAEGQGVLAELVTYDRPAADTLAAARAWYDEAAEAARRALASHPQLLAKLGLT